jgi:hypothetical protein
MEPVGIERHRWAKPAGMSGSERVKITEDVRKHAAEHSLTNDEAIESGLREKAEEFARGGAEVYAKT